jgi:cytochrome c oxidase subunit 2
VSAHLYPTLMAPLAADPAGSVWLPPAASSEAGSHDSLFYFILYLSIFFFVLVVGAMLFFVIKYRRRSADQKTSSFKHHSKLEFAWAAIPAVILVFVFVWGFKGFMASSVPPGDAIEVRVTAQRWSWTFDYPKDGISTSELVVPVGRPVKLTMSSLDVIHSFYVPAFRVKRDVLPNRYTVLWFTAEEKGDYDVMCAEYCGTKHSSMLAKVRVMSEQGYTDWIDSGGGLSGKGMSSAEFGKLLFNKKGCLTCHSVDGSKLTGPSMKGKYNTLETLAGGKQVKVDDNYLRESITTPNAKVVQGYKPVMPTYAGRLKEKQLNAIIDYIKSLGGKEKK